MNAPLRAPIRFDVQGLVKAIADNHSNDSFTPALTPAQWELLGTYMQPFALMQGQVLIEQNAQDRTVYLVESGSLTVHYEDDKGRLRLALVGPGFGRGRRRVFHPPAAQRHGAGRQPEQGLVPDADPLHRAEQPAARHGTGNRHGAGFAGVAPPGQQAQTRRGDLSAHARPSPCDYFTACRLRQRRRSGKNCRDAPAFTLALG